MAGVTFFLMTSTYNSLFQLLINSKQGFRSDNFYPPAPDPDLSKYSIKSKYEKEKLIFHASYNRISELERNIIKPMQNKHIFLLNITDPKP